MDKWVYLVSTEQITNRVSLEIIGIGYGSSQMDRDRYSGNEIRDEPPALLSLTCVFGEALKTNEKESYMTQKIEISDIGIPDIPPPPPRPPSKKVLNVYLKMS